MGNVISIVVQSNHAIGKGEVLKTIEEALRAKYPELLIEVPSSYTDNAAVLLTSKVVLSEGISTPGLGLAVESVDVVEQAPSLRDIPTASGQEAEATTAGVVLKLFQQKHAGQHNTHVILVVPRKTTPDFTLRLAYADGLYTVDMPNDTFVTSHQDIATQIFMQHAVTELPTIKEWDWLSLMSHPGVYLSWSNNAVIPFSVQLHEQNGMIRMFTNQGVDRVNTQFSTNFVSVSPAALPQALEEAFGKRITG